MLFNIREREKKMINEESDKNDEGNSRELIINKDKNRISKRAVLRQYYAAFTGELQTQYSSFTQPFGVITFYCF